MAVQQLRTHLEGYFEGRFVEILLWAMLSVRMLGTGCNVHA
jgi:hypothetical protein